MRREFFDNENFISKVLARYGINCIEAVREIGGIFIDVMGPIDKSNANASRDKFLVYFNRWLSRKAEEFFEKTGTPIQETDDDVLPEDWVWLKKFINNTPEKVIADTIERGLALSGKNPSAKGQNLKVEMTTPPLVPIPLQPPLPPQTTELPITNGNDWIGLEGGRQARLWFSEQLTTHAITLISRSGNVEKDFNIRIANNTSVLLITEFNHGTDLTWFFDVSEDNISLILDVKKNTQLVLLCTLHNQPHAIIVDHGLATKIFNNILTTQNGILQNGHVRRINIRIKNNKFVLQHDPNCVLPSNNWEAIFGRQGVIEEGNIENIARHGMTAAELKKHQDRQQEIGQKGEIYVADYEKKYLTQHNRPDLAEKVIRVSETDVGAGYDILSFDLDGREKYIEVKATTNPTNTGFEVTQNELNIAKEKGSQYWLYFVRNIEGHPKTMMTIRNIYQEIGNTIKTKPIIYKAKLDCFRTDFLD